RRRHNGLVHRLGVIALICAAGCSGDDVHEFECHAPATIQYDCQPIPAGSYGCVGGPVWKEHYSGPEHREEPDKVFPVLCQVELPECGCCYSSGRTLVCEGNYGQPSDAGVDGAPVGPASWGEPL